MRQKQQYKQNMKQQQSSEQKRSYRKSGGVGLTIEIDDE